MIFCNIFKSHYKIEYMKKYQRCIILSLLAFFLILQPFLMIYSFEDDAKVKASVSYSDPLDLDLVVNPIVSGITNFEIEGWSFYGFSNWSYYLNNTHLNTYIHNGTGDTYQKNTKVYTPESLVFTEGSLTSSFNRTKWEETDNDTQRIDSQYVFLHDELWFYTDINVSDLIEFKEYWTRFIINWTVRSSASFGLLTEWNLLIWDTAKSGSNKFVDFPQSISTTMQNYNYILTFNDKYLINNTFIRIGFYGGRISSWYMIWDQLNLVMEYETLSANYLHHIYSFSSTQFADGTYLFRSIVRDNLGNILEKNKTIIIDNTPVTVLNESVIAIGDKVFFFYNYTDINGINTQSKLYVRYNDSNSGMENRIMLCCSEFDLKGEFWQKFAKGSYEFTFHIEDMAGNVYENSYIVSVVDVPLYIFNATNILITSPNDIQLNINGLITINTINCTGLKVYENDILIFYNYSIVDEFWYWEKIVNSSYVRQDNYKIYYNTTSSINELVNFTIYYVNYTQTIYVTTYQNTYLFVSFPEYVQFGEISFINIFSLNITEYNVYENSSLIFTYNGGLPHQFVEITTLDECEKFYQIMANNIEINFTIYFVNFTVLVYVDSYLCIKYPNSLQLHDLGCITIETRYYNYIEILKNGTLVYNDSWNIIENNINYPIYSNIEEVGNYTIRLNSTYFGFKEQSFMIHFVNYSVITILNESYRIIHPNILPLNYEGYIELSDLHLVIDYAIYDSDTSVLLYYNINAGYLAVESSIECIRNYTLLINTTTKENIRYDFSIQFKNFTEIIHVDHLMSVSYPSVVKIGVYGYITINVSNIIGYDVYEEGSLIANGSSNATILVISSSVATYEYLIVFYCYDSEEYSTTFSINFVEAEVVIINNYYYTSQYLALQYSDIGFTSKGVDIIIKTKNVSYVEAYINGSIAYNITDTEFSFSIESDIGAMYEVFIIAYNDTGVIDSYGFSVTIIDIPNQNPLIITLWILVCILLSIVTMGFVYRIQQNYARLRRLELAKQGINPCKAPRILTEKGSCVIPSTLLNVRRTRFWRRIK